MKSFSLIQRLTNKIKIQPGNIVKIGNHIGLSKCTVVIKGENNTLFIQDNVRLRNMTIEIVGNNCSISIGEKCVIGQGCYLSSKEENIHLKIGNNCMFSRNVHLLTSDGHPIFQNDQRINPAGDIVIGDHVWLADHVTVLKGTVIGDNSVIGIRSLVTKSIPEKSVAVGVPAKVVKTDIIWAN